MCVLHIIYHKWETILQNFHKSMHVHVYEYVQMHICAGKNWWGFYKCLVIFGTYGISDIQILDELFIVDET